VKVATFWKDETKFSLRYLRLRIGQSGTPGEQRTEKRLRSSPARLFILDRVLNAEALRVQALRVGSTSTENFVSSFASRPFKIVNGQKQGGMSRLLLRSRRRVLHVVAGPVDANTMLREAKWVVETTKKANGRKQERRRSIQSVCPQATPNGCGRSMRLVVEPVTSRFDRRAGRQQRPDLQRSVRQTAGPSCPRPD